MRPEPPCRPAADAATETGPRGRARQELADFLALLVVRRHRRLAREAGPPPPPPRPADLPNRGSDP